VPSDARHAFAKRLRDLQLARARLAPLTLAELLVRLPGETARACGFERALLLLVRDGELVAGGVADEPNAEVATDFLRVARAMRPRLDDMPLEAEVVERRGPLLVADVSTERRVFRPLTGLANTTAFVIAPMVHPDRTIALLYGDVRGERPLDDLDRDLLWTFASATAPLLHLATLAAIARVPTVPEPSEAPPGAALTPREVEVLRLLAEGASNAAIAARLVVSETTVKTHVRQILRKLNAANRTEAAMRYARLAGRPG
jgi:DNA-binding CsgD family transcriptional regulator